jgi:putative ABC transport system substrate-binding protein
MRRRELIKVIVGPMTAGPWAASGEAERRLAVLLPFSEGDLLAAGFLKALRKALTELGWREGGNLKIDLRWGSGRRRSLS